MEYIKSEHYDHVRNDYGREMIILSKREWAEVKQGKWIGKPISGHSTVRCSACREVFLDNSGKWRFCPNCGARMEEE